MPLGVILSQVEEGMGMLRKVFAEPLVEISEAQEGLHLLLVRWGWPFCDSGNFDQVHRDGVVRYDHSEVFDRHFFEFTLVRPEVQLVFFQ